LRENGLRRTDTVYIHYNAVIAQNESRRSNRDKMSDGYTKNEANAGYQDNYMGEMNTKKENKRKRKRKKKGFKIMRPRRRKRERERQTVAPAGDNEINK